MKSHAYQCKLSLKVECPCGNPKEYMDWGRAGPIYFVEWCLQFGCLSMDFRFRSKTLLSLIFVIDRGINAGKRFKCELEAERGKRGKFCIKIIVIFNLNCWEEISGCIWNADLNFIYFFLAEFLWKKLLWRWKNQILPTVSAHSS